MIYSISSPAPKIEANIAEIKSNMNHSLDFSISSSISSAVFPEGSTPASCALCASSTALVFPPASKSSSVFAVDGSLVTSFKPLWNSPLDCPAALASFGNRSAPNNRGKKRLPIESLFRMVRTSCYSPLTPANTFRFVNQSAINPRNWWK